jgi:hypothetical protein
MYLEIAHVSAPSALANITPKCPMPPNPTIPTFLPGPHPFRTRGEKAVRPAQSIGAACSVASSSGMGKTLFRLLALFIQRVETCKSSSSLGSKNR